MRDASSKICTKLTIVPLLHKPLNISVSCTWSNGRQKICHAIRHAKARLIADALHQWMLADRQKVQDGSGTARALDYSLKRWTALTRYLDDGAVPIDNNWVENQIRPWALGRSNWLFAGSLRRGQRAAAVMTLIQSAKLNGHDPYAYLKDVLTRLPTQKNNAIDELLPHNWTPVILSKV